LIAGGEVHPGTEVVALPSGGRSRVSRIVTYDGDLPRAAAGQSVTLTLEDEIDISRGELICAAAAPARLAERIEVRLLWMGQGAVRPGQSYVVKIGSATAQAVVQSVRSAMNLVTLEAEPATQLTLNEIGDCVLSLDRPLAFDSYSDNRDTGSLILIDRETYDTLAMGLVSDERVQPVASLPQADITAATADHGAPAPAGSPVGWLAATHDKPWRSLAKAVSWRITGSIDTTILAFIFTGNIKVAASIGGAEIFTKIALYFIHERIWSRLGFGLGPEAKAALQARRAAAKKG
jgi:uncharacterized membrane protein